MTTENFPSLSDSDLAKAQIPRRQSPLLPEAGAAGTPLTLVLIVLAFLASLSLAGFFLVSKAAAEWSGDLAGTITIQVKGVGEEAVSAQADAALQALRDTSGIIAATRLPRAEIEERLAPWIGRDNLGADIPIPAIITAEVSPALRRDLAPLTTKLGRVAPAATIDDHGTWNDQLIAGANRAKLIAFLAFAMVMGATVCVIIFAARAGLAANRQIVEVMHLVGATDGFIADNIQRRYLTISLKGGLIGTLVAIGAVTLLGRLGAGEDGSFLPSPDFATSTLIFMLLVPALMAATATLTARVTVRRVLAGGFA